MDKKFYSHNLADLSGLPRDKKPRYPVMNFKLDNDDPTKMIVESIADDYVPEIRPEKKERYQHEEYDKREADDKEEYAGSDEYNIYKKEQKVRRLEIAEKSIDKLFSKQGAGATNSGIIHPSPMPPKMDSIKNTPLDKKEQLSPEDLKLREDIYKMKEGRKNELIHRLSTNKNSKNINNLAEFNNDPYEAMKAGMGNRLAQYRAELGLSTNSAQKKEIEKEIEILEAQIKTLERAEQVKIPLTLDKPFTPKEIKLDGRIFKVDEWKDKIGWYSTGTGKNYTIKGVVRRGRDEYVVFKNEAGKEFEINTDILRSELKEKEAEGKDPAPSSTVKTPEEISAKEKEKGEEIKKLRPGFTIIVRGADGRKSVYKMLRIEDDKMVLEGETEAKDKEGNISYESMGTSSMPIAELKALLLHKNNEFFIEDRRTGEEKQLLYDKFLQMVDDLKVVNSDTVQRWMKISKEEADELLEEYNQTNQKGKKRERKKKLTLEEIQEEIKRVEAELAIEREKDSGISVTKEEKDETAINTPPTTSDLIKSTKDSINETMDTATNKEGMEKRLNREELEKEIEENIKGLLDKIKEKKPEIKEFLVTSRATGFAISSKIRINKTGNFLKPKVDIDLSMNFLNKDDKLVLANWTIDAGIATSKVEEQLEPLFPQIIPGIKKHFEQKLGKTIESMKMEGRELVLQFKKE